MSMAQLVLISDFNAELLARYLSQRPDAAMSVEAAPFGQVYQSLSALPAGDGGIVWTLPEGVLPSFARALELAEVDADQCLDEVSAFAAAILKYAARARQVFVASWVLPGEQRGYGMLDWRPGLGLAHLLARMNLRLSERLSEAQNVYLLDASRWSAAAARAASPKMWYAAKVPYANPVFEKAASDIDAALRALSGRSRKLIIVDLDNTLWGGVIGETGWEGIVLGGHDPVGEAFVDFQRGLRALSQRGIQLGIVSKNDEAVALAAIDQHSAMALRRAHFAGWRINWGDKAENIAALVAELNLGLSAVVFIDDNPAERERVRGAFPEVLVPEWPLDPCAYPNALHALDCFDTSTLSSEDRLRTAMYVSERGRRETQKAVASPEDWLRQLGTRLSVDAVDRSNVARVAQLFNKTNQLNLRTRRMNEAEVLDWASQPDQRLLAISVADCFGDLGLVGVLGVEARGSQAELVDFILSCRVMGRRIEQAMLHLAVVHASELGATRLWARYLPTARNRPTLDVLRSVGLDEPEQHLFTFEGSTAPAAPDTIAIVSRGTWVAHA
jgi:FkbH-like protein